jgi:hypothetical protein
MGSCQTRRVWRELLRDLLVPSERPMPQQRFSHPSRRCSIADRVDLAGAGAATGGYVLAHA